MPVWDPEHAVDEDLARRLVSAQWPDLADLRPTHLGAGWDVDVWCFGDLAVRFPRRNLGVRCLENELRVLPAIADRVPVAVPRPLRVGVAALGYPSRFYAHAYLPGAPAIRAGLDDDARARLAAPLGAFLRALHAISLPPLRTAGLADDDRGDVARVAARGASWLATCADALSPAVVDRAAAVFATIPPTDVAATLVHADFHAGNLLVDAAGAMTAAIDWGDCAAGDPAIDLAIGWSLVPPRARADFVAAYGPITPATWARARIGALARQGLALLAWGRDLGDATVTAFAHAAVERTLTG